MLKLNESRYDWQDKKSYIAIIIFIITWLLLIKRWSAIKVGHSTVAIFGCSLMVLFDIITSEETFSTCRETLLLVAAFMIIHLKLEQTSLAEFLKRVLLYGKPTPSWLLARVSILSGTLAALIMDNGSVTFLSPLVFHLCDENHLEIEPFMLALVTSANIGSVATVIGNVKNMIIAENVTEMSFSGFFIHMAPIALIGLILNTIFLMFYYRKRFIGQTIKSYKPSKATNIASKPTTNPRNATPTLRVITDSRTIETTYDSDEEAIVAGMISDSDEREESDTENNDDDSQHSEGENSSLLARKKRLLHSKPHYANDFCSSPDRSPLKRNYAFEQVVYMDDNDNDDGGTSPWVIRRDNSSYSPRQNQPALTRFAWDAPHEPHGLQGLGSSIQKQTKQFISDTKSFFGNGNSFKKIFFILMMFGMYIAMFFEKSLGWTAVTVASLFLLFFDGKNSTNVINKINWGLIVYLIGIVGIIRGLHGTQLPHFLWDHYEGVFIRPDIKNIMSIFALSFISILLALSLTSIPATLLLLPYMSEMMDERFAGFLLAWNIVLVGNLSAGKSSAGLIVSEIAKDHLFDTPLVQPHEFSTWGKYSVWSTVIILIVGTFIISFLH